MAMGMPPVRACPETNIKVSMSVDLACGVCHFDQGKQRE
jgi:hypothetical protein